jgi:hypothetical protein
MKAILSTAVTMVVMGLSISAYAGDPKSYPATMCQGFVFEGRTSSVSYEFGKPPIVVPYLVTIPVTAQVTGAAVNSSTQADMMLICPIVRDVVRADGLTWNSLLVTALNLSLTRELKCEAESFYPNDYGFGSKSSNKLGPNKPWTDLSFSVLSAPADGYLLVRCLVPRKDSDSSSTVYYPSGLGSYRIDE